MSHLEDILFLGFQVRLAQQATAYPKNIFLFIRNFYETNVNGYKANNKKLCHCPEKNKKKFTSKQQK